MTQKSLFVVHPQVIYLDVAGFLENDALLQCPVCKNVDDWNNYDCLGADEDCIFCNNCGTELQT